MLIQAVLSNAVGQKDLQDRKIDHGLVQKTRGVFRDQPPTSNSFTLAAYLLPAPMSALVPWLGRVALPTTQNK